MWSKFVYDLQRWCFVQIGQQYDINELINMTLPFSLFSRYCKRTKGVDLGFNGHIAIRSLVILCVFCLAAIPSFVMMNNIFNMQSNNDFALNHRITVQCRRV